MLRITLLFASIGMIAARMMAVQERTWLEDENSSATPGALSVSLNTTSMTNMLNTFVPLMAYFALNNQTFTFNYTKSSTLYEVDFKDIHIVKATGFKEKSMQYIPGTDKVHLRISEIDLVTDVNADLYGLHFIPFKASHVNVTNMTIDFIFQSTSNDSVHWELVETANVTIGKVDIEMSNSFLNWCVRMMSGTINKVIQDFLPKVGDVVYEEVQKLNKMVAGEGPYTFDVNTMGKDFPLNLTMTTAPEMKEGSYLIKMFFDGLFDVPQNMNITNDWKVKKNTEMPPRFPHSHSEQFIIHQSMINSALKVADNALFPFVLDDQNVTSQLLQAFPEITKQYGKGVKVMLGLSLLPNNTEAPVSFDKVKGIVIGNNDTIMTKVDVICSNETVQNETAVNFVMNLEVIANLSMKDLIFYPHVDNITVSNTQVKRDLIGMYARDYNNFFQQVLKNAVNDFNLQWVKGWNVDVLDPRLLMVTGLIKNATMSPYVADGWMYAGFTLQADLPTAVHQLEFDEEFIQ